MTKSCHVTLSRDTCSWSHDVVKQWFHEVIYPEFFDDLSIVLDPLYQTSFVLSRIWIGKHKDSQYFKESPGNKNIDCLVIDLQCKFCIISNRDVSNPVSPRYKNRFMSALSLGIELGRFSGNISTYASTHAKFWNLHSSLMFKILEFQGLNLILFVRL